MKMFLISDNIDTLTGMRLAGIQGVVVHQEKEINEAIDQVLKDSEIGVVLMTEKINDIVYDRVMDIKLNRQLPLIVTIPDRHGSQRGLDSITRYVRDAIGLKI